MLESTDALVTMPFSAPSSPMTLMGNFASAATGSTSPIHLLPYKDVYGVGFEDMARRVPDLSKLERTIGYRPRTSLDQIIGDVVAEQRAALGGG